MRDAFDPEQNVRGGFAYLKWLIARYDGDIARVAGAYNAGEGTVDRYGGVPPYAETEEYVRRILAFYRARRHVAGGRGRLRSRLVRLFLSCPATRSRRRGMDSGVEKS